MNKIDFKNLPDTSTPLSAENLNQLQTNVETAIDGKISNTSGTSQTIGYSQEYVNNALLDVYSTTETRIGTWIDGKPLYRKVFTISSPQSSNTNYEDLSSLNTNKIIRLYGYYETPNGKFDIPFYDSDSNYSVMFVSSGRLLRGRFGSASSITEAKVVLEYTKTTD